MGTLRASDPRWPTAFLAERDVLRAALGALEVEHIGSTAIPGLPAKPIIDIAVCSDEDLTNRVQPLGYRPNLAGPRTHSVFIKGERSHILHVFSSRQWEQCNQRLFRDHLLANPSAVRRYAGLKRDLVNAGVSGLDYTAGKTALVQELVNAERAVRGLPPTDVWDK